MLQAVRTARCGLPGKWRQEISPRNLLLPLLFALASGATPVALAAGPAGKPAAPSALPAGGLVLRGSLGEQQVQMHLRPKPDEEGGVEGEYFRFGQGGKILLAGEFEQDGSQNFWLEESANGTDVSGQWEGRREGALLTGSWRGADEGPVREFRLRIVPPPPRAASRPASR
ncbi:MAG: hypothetical protein JWP36_876 [Paucimonas sp.]|nr:hypothetical protein [Paucimonas sp.]